MGQTSPPHGVLLLEFESHNSSHGNHCQAICALDLVASFWLLSFAMIVDIARVFRHLHATACKRETTGSRPTSGKTFRRLPVVVVTAALMFAICANTMVSTTVLAPKSSKAKVRQDSRSSRSAPTLLGLDDTTLHGTFLLTDAKRRRLIKKVTRLRDKLEETVQAMQSQHDAPHA